MWQSSILGTLLGSVLGTVLGGERGGGAAPHRTLLKVTHGHGLYTACGGHRAESGKLSQRYGGMGLLEATRRQNGRLESYEAPERATRAQ